MKANLNKETEGVEIKEVISGSIIGKFIEQRIRTLCQ
jgi:hypothetical protein